MSEPNPYEAPRTEQPLKPAQIVKRGIGVVLILVLAPLVTFVTFFVTCSTLVALDMQGRAVPTHWAYPLLLGPPTIYVAAMILWALLARRRTLLARDKAERQCRE